MRNSPKGQLTQRKSWASNEVAARAAQKSALYCGLPLEGWNVYILLPGLCTKISSYRRTAALIKRFSHCSASAAHLRLRMKSPGWWREKTVAKDPALYIWHINLKCQEDLWSLFMKQNLWDDQWEERCFLCKWIPWSVDILGCSFLGPLERDASVPVIWGSCGFCLTNALLALSNKIHFLC